MYQWSCTPGVKELLGEKVQRENGKQSPERGVVTYNFYSEHIVSAVLKCHIALRCERKLEMKTGSETILRTLPEKFREGSEREKVRLRRSVLSIVAKTGLVYGL